MPGDGGSGGRGRGPRGSSVAGGGRGGEGHTPAPHEWVLTASAASQPLPLLGVNQQICEHPSSDLAFSETAESPEGSPSVLLPLCVRQGRWGLLGALGAAAFLEPLGKCAWVETHSSRSWWVSGKKWLGGEAGEMVLLGNPWEEA